MTTLAVVTGKALASFSDGSYAGIPLDLTPLCSGPDSNCVCPGPVCGGFFSASDAPFGAEPVNRGFGGEPAADVSMLLYSCVRRRSSSSSRAAFFAARPKANQTSTNDSMVVMNGHGPVA